MSRHQSRKVSALACESMTPLGCPVDPEVKRMNARSSSASGGGRGEGASSARTSAQRVPEGDRVRGRGRRAGDDQPGQGTCRRPGRAEGRRQSGVNDHRFDARRGQDAGGSRGGTSRVNGDVGRAGGGCRGGQSRPRGPWATRAPPGLRVQPHRDSRVATRSAPRSNSA